MRGGDTLNISFDFIHLTIKIAGDDWKILLNIPWLIVFGILLFWLISKAVNNICRDRLYTTSFFDQIKKIFKKRR